VDVTTAGSVAIAGIGISEELSVILSGAKDLLPVLPLQSHEGTFLFLDQAFFENEEIIQSNLFAPRVTAPMSACGTGSVNSLDRIPGQWSAVPGGYDQAR